MSEWKHSKIGLTCEVGDGAHASIKRVDNGKLYLTSKNFTKDGLTLNTVDYISEEDFAKHFKEKSKAITKPKLNDVLLSIIGTIGAPYLVKDEEFGLSSSVSILRPNNDVILSEYLLYWIKSDFFQKSLNAIKSGVAQSFLSLEMIKSLPLIYPKELHTQKRIASILSAYDDLIENNLKRIKLLEELAQRTYEEWFVKFRINGVQLEVGENGLPDGWKEKEFQFFGEIITGKTPSTLNEDFFNGNIPFVKTPDMSGFPYVLDTNHKLSELGANTQKKKFIPKNSLMISCIGSAGIYALASQNCQTNQQINSIAFFEEHYSFYFYCFAKKLKPVLEGLGSNGATMTNVNKGKFEKMKAVFPSEDILICFHNQVKNNFKVILNLQNQNRLLKESRDILLPRLMSGKIGVDKIVKAQNEILKMVAEPREEYNKG